MDGALTLVDGNTFLISNPAGDVPAGLPCGLFFADTRFLSKFLLKINGRSPEVLRARPINSYAASIYATNPVDRTFGPRTIGLIRDRFVGEGFHENIILENHGHITCDIKLTIDFDADFADLFEVKSGRFTEADKAVVATEADSELVFLHEHGSLVRRTRVSFSATPRIEDRTAIFSVRLAPRESWRTCLTITLSVADETFAPRLSCTDFDRFVPGPARDKEQWLQSIPRLSTDNDNLRHLYERSVADLAALRFPVDGHYLPAAGVPWFMAIFGRDSLITALQALPVAPDLAVGALKVLAGYQGRQVDDFRDEEPGKIVHEIRFGELSVFKYTPHARYYGTVDATPLYLVLLGETYKWTGDLELVRALLPNAESALRWIDEYGDLDGDGFVEYNRRSPQGLVNQGWKDSGDAVVFADGRPAEGPIALAEVQGYVYRAKMQMAELFGKLGEPEKARELVDQAQRLKRAFNDKFWLEKEGYFTLALDGDKRPVDSVTSNPGHCLWSGIIDQDKAVAVADRLLAPDMFSGWGIRTMSERMSGFSPISYHNGSVWPHDNSIIVAGLAAYGFHDHARRVTAAMLQAAANLPDYRLPELFAGYGRRPSGFPVLYPTASVPQSWATGSVFMFLQMLLG